MIVLQFSAQKLEHYHFLKGIFFVYSSAIVCLSSSHKMLRCCSQIVNLFLDKLRVDRHMLCAKLRLSSCILPTKQW